MFKRTKRVLLITILILAAVTSGFILRSEKIIAADKLARETIKVRVKIAANHQFKLLTEPVVEFEYPWPGSEAGEDLLIENAVKSEIASNASWNLAVNNRLSTDFTVLIKRSGENRAAWQQLSNHTAFFSGSHGREEAAFDIKVLAPKGRDVLEISRERLNLEFTISH